MSSQGTSSKFFLLLRDPYPHTSLLLRVTSTHPSLPPSLPPSLQVRCSSVGHFPLTSSKQGFLVTQYLGEGTDVFEGEEGGRGGGREGLLIHSYRSVLKFSHRHYHDSPR